MKYLPSEILLNGLPTLDVRSPAEFEKGHAIGAINFPLFSNEERHKVGLSYKEQGRDAAVKLGFELVGKRLHDYIEEARRIAPGLQVNMYCWRGGMRSSSMAWLLETAGFKVQLIEGGYKAWRNEALSLLDGNFHYINLCGLTGVGKTDILSSLQRLGEQVIDLEQLARHTGSAFNNIEGEQPQSEQFDNLVADRLLSFDPGKIIWLEDESKSIGKVFLNHQFYLRKNMAPKVWLNRSKEERVQHLCEIYAQLPKEVLKASFAKIERRIGGQYLQAAEKYIDDDNYEAAVRIALRYYDKAYMHSLSKQSQSPVFTLSLNNKSPDQVAGELIQWKTKYTAPLDSLT